MSEKMGNNCTFFPAEIFRLFFLSLSLSLLIDVVVGIRAPIPTLVFGPLETLTRGISLPNFGFDVRLFNLLSGICHIRMRIQTFFLAGKYYFNYGRMYFIPRFFVVDNNEAENVNSKCG